jgi:hypothetical protein
MPDLKFNQCAFSAGIAILIFVDFVTSERMDVAKVTSDHESSFTYT